MEVFMKKIVCLLLLSCLLFAMTGCGGEKTAELPCGLELGASYEDVIAAKDSIEHSSDCFEGGMYKLKDGEIYDQHFTQMSFEVDKDKPLKSITVYFLADKQQFYALNDYFTEKYGDAEEELSEGTEAYHWKMSNATINLVYSDLFGDTILTFSEAE